MFLWKTNRGTELSPYFTGKIHGKNSHKGTIFFLHDIFRKFYNLQVLTSTHFVRPQTLDVLNIPLTSQNSVVLQKTILKNDKGQYYVKCNKMQQK